MDKMTRIKINGVERYMNFSIETLFDVNDKFGGVQQLLAELSQKNKNAIEATCWCAEKFINDGELCRRAAGYDKNALISEKELSARMRPADFETIRAAVIKTITIGFEREITADDEERDLGLEELNAKKEKAGE